MSVEDEFARLLAAQAAASDQLRSEIGKTAETLATFRTQLIVNGFSTNGAEDMTLEWFIKLLDAPRDDDD